MLQRNTGQLSQSFSGGLGDKGESAAGGPLGIDSQPIARSLPGNVLDPKDLATVPAESLVVGEQYLVFSLLGCELALKAEHIQGVERLADVTPIPNVAPWIRGVINLRGSIVSVVDLRSFLDMEQLPYNPRTRLLSVQYNEMVICLIVDGVSEMVPIPPSAITNLKVRQTTIPQWALPYAYGSALLDKRVIVLLDAARLLFSDKMQHYSVEL